MTITSKRIRSGLYEVVASAGVFMVEDFQDWDTSKWAWRVTDDNEFYGDFDTKAQALQMIGAMA